MQSQNNQIPTFILNLESCECIKSLKMKKPSASSRLRAKCERTNTNDIIQSVVGSLTITRVWNLIVASQHKAHHADVSLYDRADTR